MYHRVSSVEAFRQWEADDDADTDALIASIRGLSEPSQAMRAGTAFHKILENAADTVHGPVEIDGFRFLFPAELEISLTQVRELRASKVYTVDGEPITISGQVDAIDGLRIEDHKTTGRFDADRYLAGYQWRLYLDIFGADVFRWNVFEIKEVESTGDSFGFDAPPPEYEVCAQHTLEQFRYPNLGADCQALVERFARFVRLYL